MRRVLFNFLAMMSLLTCVLAVAIGCRSYIRSDNINYHHFGMMSYRGELLFSWNGSYDSGQWAYASDMATRDSELEDQLENPGPLRGFHRMKFKVEDEVNGSTGWVHILWLPIWLPFAVGCPLSLIYGSAVLRRHRRIESGRCRKCGYDLRATRDRCPECGTATAPKL